jgi:malate synthase
VAKQAGAKKSGQATKRRGGKGRGKRPARKAKLKAAKKVARKPVRKAARKPVRKAAPKKVLRPKRRPPLAKLRPGRRKPAPLRPSRAGATPRGAGIEVLGRSKPGYSDILSAAALSFVADLQRKFGPERARLLAKRAALQAKLDAGEKPGFLAATRSIRAGGWRVAPLPADLQDRRVEITGPTDRKMVINALNCGANVFMADFEDANTPTWDNLLEGQINLRDAVAGTIAYADPASGKSYRLNPKTATLMARPRGWHLDEKHLLVDGAPVAGGLFDFGLFFFHNARALLAKGSGPYFYLPKLENHLEARLWNDVFLHAQRALGLAPGTIKATALIETILASFEMDEILYELRQHSAGLNCGRWDYIFSFIKKFRAHPWALTPDRAAVTMTAHFLRSYSRLLIQTCHKRGAQAMGGMAAQIPIKNDPIANAAAMAKVKADKEREVTDGHDGTWVAHPGLVDIAKAVFDKGMPGPNQIAKPRQDVNVTAADLLQAPAGVITEAGLRQNLDVGIGYVEAWLRGQGCVPLHNLMEDAATAEISRAQVWQWLRHGAKLADGRTVDAALCRAIVVEVLARARAQLGDAAYAAGRHKDAARLFGHLIEARQFEEFLTLPAYDLLIKEGR